MKLPVVVTETQPWCLLVLQSRYQLTGIQEWRWCASVPVETSSDGKKISFRLQGCFDFGGFVETHRWFYTTNRSCQFCCCTNWFISKCHLDVSKVQTRHLREPVSESMRLQSNAQAWYKRVEARVEGKKKL